jgi:hypothetical protein
MGEEMLRVLEVGGGNVTQYARFAGAFPAAFAASSPSYQGRHWIEVEL